MTEQNTIDQKQEQQSKAEPANATPAETGGNQNKGRVFTQDEVNQIVSDRLNRERDRASEAAQQQTNQREQELTSREQEMAGRENVLKCREFVSENSGRYPKALLDVLDTSDFEGFKETADKLLKAFPELSPDFAKKLPRFKFTGPISNNGNSFQNDPLRAAFLGK